MRVLHVGYGGSELPEWMPKCEETTVDIDPRTKPDIVASMLDLGEIGPFDVVYCCHALEHLYPDEVPVALGEFYRVLAPGGAVILFVPDLEGVTPSDWVLYESPAGPVTSWDLIYGMRRLVGKAPSMAHKTGFVADSLFSAISRAGFVSVETKRLSHYNLMGVGKRKA